MQKDYDIVGLLPPNETNWWGCEGKTPSWSVTDTKGRKAKREDFHGFTRIYREISDVVFKAPTRIDVVT